MKKALLIGINYKGTSAELQGCIRDIETVRDVLVTHFHFPTDNIVMLSDADGASHLPTKANILSAIGDLVQNVKEGDELVFHYSGHGVQVRDYSGDEKDRIDEAMAPLDYEQVGFITDDILNGVLISKIPKGAKLVAFFDCCHSGTICDLEWNFKYSSPERTSQPNFERWGNSYMTWNENKYACPGDVSMFSGCLDKQTSADAYINLKNQGAFTYCLVKVLNDNKFLITNKTLLKHINAQLAVLGFEQRTQFSCSRLSMFEELFDM